MDKPNQVSAEPLAALRRVTGLPVLECQRLLAALPAEEREERIRGIETGKIQAGPPPRPRGGISN